MKPAGSPKNGREKHHVEAHAEKQHPRAKRSLGAIAYACGRSFSSSVASGANFAVAVVLRGCITTSHPD